MKDSHINNNIKKRLIHSVLTDFKNNEIGKRELNKYLSSIKNFFDKDDIAVIGISCEFPDAKNHVQFWDNLIHGKESIKHFPEKRADDFNKVFDIKEDIRKGGFLDEIDEFDAEYFKIPPTVASQMDPYHRKTLKIITRCMEDAGYDKEQLYGTKTGVFIGHDHTHRLVTSYFDFLSEIDFPSIIGAWTGMLSSRISYLYNFTGPALVLDSGCSSSMVAIDAALNAIKKGDCDTALVGGINLFFLPNNLDKGAQSWDYRVRPFDDSANGTVWSEGVACVYLKPMSKAIGDKDHIYGVIKGIAVNNDGKTSSLTAPSVSSQKEVIMRAWEKAEVSPEQISYIESHGTGTVLGDPIELKALTEAFAAHTNKKQFCGIGSVKSNIGHTVGLSGIASLIKILLTFEFGVIPPTINFNEPNKFIDFHNSPIYIQKCPDVWKDDMKELTVGISSFSFTGTNAHMVAQSYVPKWRDDVKKPFVFPLSAKNKTLLIKSIENYCEYLGAKDYRIEDVSYTMCCRKHQDARVIIITDNLAKLVEALKMLITKLYIDSKTEKASIREEGFQLYYGEWDRLEENENPELENRLVISYLNRKKADFHSLFEGIEVYKCSLPPVEFDNKRYWEINRKKAVSLQAQSPVDAPNKEMKSLQDLIRETWCSVLGYREVKDGDNFFQLGGDSITGAKITYCLSASISKDISATAILNYPVFVDYYEYINKLHLEEDNNDKNKMNELVNSSVMNIVAAKPQSIANAVELPLISPQRSMFLTHQITDSASVYDVVAILENEWNAVKNQIKSAVDQLLDRHEALRSRFIYQNDKPTQIIEPHISAEIEIYQIESEGYSVEDTLKKQLKKVFRAFQLESAPLFRVYNVIIDMVYNYIIFDIHHMITDGTSMGILIGEFSNLMDGKALSDKNYNYKNIVDEIWRRENNDSMEKHRSWWMEKFKDGVPVLNIPTDRQRHSIRNYKGNRLTKKIGGESFNEIKSFSVGMGSTMYMLLIGALYHLICKLSNDTNHVIGTPVANRNTKEELNAVGLFVSTIPLKLNVSQSVTVLESLKELRMEILESFQHQEFNYEMLLESLNIKRNSGSNPLFDIYFSLQNIDMGMDQEKEAIELDTENIKFDLTIVAREVKDGLIIDWEYSTELFDRETIDNLADRYSQLLINMINNPDRVVEQLELVSKQEEEQFVQLLRNPVADYTEDYTVVTIFETLAKDYSDCTAAIFKDEEIKYRELNTRANVVAELIRKQTTEGNHPVALLFDRSIDMIISIFGVLKAGCYYIPVDINNPISRIEDIIIDSESRIVMTHKSYGTDLAFDHVEILRFEDIDFTKEGENLCISYSNSDIAYMIYTSGTSGKPKGTLIYGKSIIRLTKDTNYIECRQSDRVLQCANYCFDASVFEIFTALLNGATLVLAERSDILDIHNLGKIIRKYKVTQMLLTTSLFNAVVEEDVEILMNVDKVLFGGEVASVHHVSKAYKYLGPGHLVNCYGPTESCVIATSYTVNSLEDTQRIPIGIPIANTTAYVLNKVHRLQPPGFPGELYIGGSGVAKGYYNKQELNEKSFIVNPYDPNEIIYKTGDQVILGADGNISYIGRLDHQVKIRGYRIEIDEITNASLRTSLIKECYCDVIEQASGSKYLYLWVIPSKEYSKGQFLKSLTKSLPEYMVPSRIIEIEQIPLNHSGKVDVLGLDIGDEVEEQTILAPINEMQKDILEVWKQVLGLNKIGINENFFTLGGDSIKAIQIVSKLRKMNYNITIATLLAYKTIEMVSEKVTREEIEGIAEPVSGFCHPTAVQQVYLNQGDFKKRFNQGIHVRTTYSITFEAFYEAIKKLIIHHDALRLRIDSLNHLFIKPAERVEELFYCVETTAHVVNKDIYKYYNKLQEKISITNGPLFAAAYYIEQNEYNFILAANHLAMDVVSWTIFIEDLFQIAEDLDGEILKKTASFNQWTKEYYEKASSGVFRRNLKHWIDMAYRIQNQPADMELVAGNNRGRKELFLSKELSAILLNKANDAFHTEASQLIVAVVSLAIAGWMKRSSLLINLEGHGRTDDSQGIDSLRIIGWFTSNYPVLIELDDNLSEFLKTTKEKLIVEAKLGNEFMGLKLFDSGLRQEERELLSWLEPKVSINYLGYQSEEMVNGIEVRRFPQEVCADSGVMNNYVLDCILSVVQSRIKIEYEYQIPEYSPFKPEALDIMIYEQAERISEYCTRTGIEEKTVSDFTASGISTTELNDVINDILF